MNLRLTSLLVALGAYCALMGHVLPARAAYAYIPPGIHADYIVVEKSRHVMTLFSGGKALKTYRVALGRGGLGRKVKSGDNKVPEGIYTIDGRNDHSKYFMSLKISYPEQRDIDEAKRRHVQPGKDIMIHGLKDELSWMGPMHRKLDWTNGCIAVTDEEIVEIWDAVPDGTKIEIRP